jgi:hypothetical protein
LREDAIARLVPRHGFEITLVVVVGVEAGAVLDELKDGDFRLVVRHVGQELFECVVERQTSLLVQ